MVADVYFGKKIYKPFILSVSPHVTRRLLSTHFSRILHWLGTAKKGLRTSFISLKRTLLPAQQNKFYTMLGIFCSLYTAISRKVVGKMCTRQYRIVILDIINTLFLTPQLSNLLLLLSFGTCKHLSVVSRTILSNFFEQQ